MSSPPKAKPSLAEIEAARTAKGMFDATSPIVNRVFTEFKKLATPEASEAVASRLKAKRQADVFQGLADIKPTTAGRLGTSLARQPLDKNILALLNVEERAKAQKLRTNAQTALAAAGTSQAVGSLRAGTRAGTALSNLAIQKARAIQASEDRLISDASTSLGMVAGQAASNYFNPNVNIFGKSKNPQTG